MTATTYFILVPHGTEFWIHDGETYASKDELFKALRHCDEPGLRIFAFNGSGFDDVTADLGSEWAVEDRAEISAIKACDGRVPGSVDAVDRAFARTANAAFHAVRKAVGA
jgi:hypothetical protein